jgi:tetratricopeptide (TPR) repeat protein
VAVSHGGESALRIFISYRRADAEDAAGRLYESLAPHASFQLFMDVTGLEPGVKYEDAIETFVGSCDALLAVIGIHWTSATDGAGRRRLDDSGDLLAREVRAGLEGNVRVIPVLVQGASMPRLDELPPGIQGLAGRQAVELRHSHWREDVDRLVATLDADVSAKAGTAQAQSQAAQTLLNKGEALYKDDRKKEALELFDQVIRDFGQSAWPGVQAEVARAMVDRSNCFSYLYDNSADIDRHFAALDEVVRKFGDSTAPEVQEQVATALQSRYMSFLYMGDKYENQLADAIDQLTEKFTDTTSSGGIQWAVAHALLVKGRRFYPSRKGDPKGLIAKRAFAALIERFGDSKYREIQDKVAEAKYKIKWLNRHW